MFGNCNHCCFCCGHPCTMLGVSLFISCKNKIQCVCVENKTKKKTKQKDTCTPMFIAALFTIAKSWKQHKCPSTDEWIKKMWSIYTMEYYSAIKRNEIGSFVETWMDLETVIQSEVSQKEKNKYRILTHVCGT